MAWRCGPVRPGEDEAADDQQDRDLPWLPEVVLDELSPRPPAITAGIVPMAMAQASR